MELLHIIVEGIVPIVGILALHWDTSLFVSYFLMESLVIGVSTWFKIEQSIPSTAFYEPEKEKVYKAGDGMRLEQTILSGLYAIYTSVFTGVALYQCGLEPFTDPSVRFTLVVSAAWQTREWVRMRNARKPTVTAGYLMLNPFKRMILMLLLVMVLSNDVTSTELNVAALVFSLGLDLWLFFYKRRYAPSTKGEIRC